MVPVPVLTFLTFVPHSLYNLPLNSRVGTYSSNDAFRVGRFLSFFNDDV